MHESFVHQSSPQRAAAPARLVKAVLIASLPLFILACASPNSPADAAAKAEMERQQDMARSRSATDQAQERLRQRREGSVGTGN